MVLILLFDALTFILLLGILLFEPTSIDSFFETISVELIFVLFEEVFIKLSEVSITISTFSFIVFFLP